ncbi:FecR family protein [Sunxiuqinia sp. sy24]|uniref:FecR family protein n=1 Tax=Sunxiuqinia sp. sy24 TaxID=3461495 RepID=UPI0040454512
MEKTEKIIKLVTGSEVEQKEQLLEELKQSDQDMATYRSAKIAWSFLAASRQAPADKVEQSYKKLANRIKLAESGKKRFMFFKYAAVLVLLIGVASMMFWLGRTTQRNNGGEQFQTSVVAAYGQIAQVVLPDSSVVWLNSGTKLTYSNGFAINSRHLELEGQALFQVSRNETLPLTVYTSSGVNVKVLGTQFDVSAYPGDEAVRVILQEGSVELDNPGITDFKRKLSPGEMMTYNTRERSMDVSTIEMENYASWKDGELIFKDEPMLEVIKKLERRFDVEIVVADLKVYKSIFNANFRNESLKEILDFIQFSCPITYQFVEEEAGKAKIIFK